MHRIRPRFVWKVSADAQLTRSSTKSPQRATHCGAQTSYYRNVARWSTSNWSPSGSLRARLLQLRPSMSGLAATAVQGVTGFVAAARLPSFR